MSPSTEKVQNVDKRPHLFYWQPLAKCWIKVCTTECSPVYNTWATAEDARRHFKAKHYRTKMAPALCFMPSPLPC